MRAKRSNSKKKAGKSVESRRFDQGKGVRRIARQRVGTPPPAKPIEPEDVRKKPKHKKAPGIDPMEE